jgi:hypothetical protein
MDMRLLNATFAANGSTSTRPYDGDAVLAFAASGTFGGGALVLQWSADGGTTWFTAKTQQGTDVSLTATGYFTRIYLPIGCIVRATLTGATTPSITLNLLQESKA